MQLQTGFLKKNEKDEKHACHSGVKESTLLPAIQRAQQNTQSLRRNTYTSC